MAKLNWAAVALLISLLGFACMTAAEKKCEPGHGGQECELNTATIFYEHEPFSDLHLRPKDLNGWSPGYEVYKGICDQAHGVQTIVEIGVWKGLSASHLANYLKSQGGGVLFAVDTWTGNLHLWKRKIHDAITNLHLKNGYPTVYWTFLSNMVHEGVSEYIIPFPVTSRMASEFFEEKKLQADVIHIDADHEYDDAKEDIALWWPLVRPCGILLGDDYSQSWPGVVKAVNEFAKDNNLKLQTDGFKWFVRKPALPSKACEV